VTTILAMPPRVSGIITTYNHEAFIGEAVQSVMDQTHSRRIFRRFAGIAATHAEVWLGLAVSLLAGRLYRPLRALRVQTTRGLQYLARRRS